MKPASRRSGGGGRTALALLVLAQLLASASPVSAKIIFRLQNRTQVGPPLGSVERRHVGLSSCKISDRCEDLLRRVLGGKAQGSAPQGRGLPLVAAVSRR